MMDILHVMTLSMYDLDTCITSRYWPPL